MSSSIGSPATDVTEEMEFEPSLVTVAEASVAEEIADTAAVPSMEQRPIIERGRVSSTATRILFGSRDSAILSEQCVSAELAGD